MREQQVLCKTALNYLTLFFYYQYTGNYLVKLFW